MKSFITLFAYIFIMYSDVSVFGEGDKFDDMLSKDPSLRTLYEQRMTAVNNSFAEHIGVINNSFAEHIGVINNSFAQSKEYESFKCAIVDGRESVHRLKSEMNKFPPSHPSHLEKIPDHLYSIIKEIVDRLCPTRSEFMLSLKFGVRYFKFFKYSASAVADDIWSILWSNETAAEMAGTIAGLYPLFCNYVHADESIQAGTPAMVEYLRLKEEGESVWLSETLQRENHWPMRMKDLKYLNILRACLEPPEYAIDYVRIKNDNDINNDNDKVNDNDVIMPISNIDKGYC